MKTILFFTAAAQATVAEQAAIAKLNSLAQPYTVKVLAAPYSALYGTTVIAADYLSGTVPDDYKDGGDPIYPLLDPDDPPVALPADKAVVEDAQEIDVDGGGSVTLTIEDGVITGCVYTAP